MAMKHMFVLPMQIFTYFRQLVRLIMTSCLTRFVPLLDITSVWLNFSQIFLGFWWKRRDTDHSHEKKILIFLNRLPNIQNNKEDTMNAKLKSSISSGKNNPDGNIPQACSTMINHPILNVIHLKLLQRLIPNAKRSNLSENMC